MTRVLSKEEVDDIHRNLTGPRPVEGIRNYVGECLIATIRDLEARLDEPRLMRQPLDTGKMKLIEKYVLKERERCAKIAETFRRDGRLTCKCVDTLANLIRKGKPQTRGCQYPHGNDQAMQNGLPPCICVRQGEP